MYTKLISLKIFRKYSKSFFLYKYKKYSKCFFVITVELSQYKPLYKRGKHSEDK